MLPTGAVIGNLVLFQLAWFACVLGAAWGHAWFGTAFTGLVVGWHLHRARDTVTEAKLVCAVLLVGCAVELTMLRAHAIQYTGGPADLSFPPHWLLALWALFAITLNVSLRWLKRRWLLAAVLGAVGAPLSFAGGVRLGAAVFTDRPKALWWLAACWAIAMPLLVWLGGRYDGMVASARRHAPPGEGAAPRSMAPADGAPPSSLGPADV